MKILTIPMAATLLAVATITPAFPQGGQLIPPVGPPAETMKTLERIAPRIPVVEGAPGVTIAGPLGIGPGERITISEPGHYFLTENVQISENSPPITITGSNVTLDLMGHSILPSVGTGNTTSAIRITGNASHVTIQNGHILPSSNQFTRGILADVGTSDILVRNISIRETITAGITLNSENSEVRNCTVVQTGSGSVPANPHGIKAGRVYQSVALEISNTAIEAGLVQDCIAESTGGGTAIIADRVIRTQAHSRFAAIEATTLVHRSEGITTNSNLIYDAIVCLNGTVSHSRGVSNTGTGIRAKIVTHSTGISTGTFNEFMHGIHATNYVAFSYGSSVSGHGIQSDWMVHSSHSETTSGNQNRHAITSGLVVNSTAFVPGFGKGSALVGGVVINSYGHSNGRDGISAGLVPHSYGRGMPDGFQSAGISAGVAVGSYAEEGENITFKADMP